MDPSRVARILQLAQAMQAAEMKMVESIEEAGPPSSYHSLMSAKEAYDTVKIRVLVYNAAKTTYREALLAP
jgi:hypothetical protein